jgi:hypothetical protein
LVLVEIKVHLEPLVPWVANLYLIQLQQPEAGAVVELIQPQPPEGLVVALVDAITLQVQPLQILHMAIVAVLALAAFMPERAAVEKALLVATMLLTWAETVALHIPVQLVLGLFHMPVAAEEAGQINIPGIQMQVPAAVIHLQPRVVMGL